MNYYNDLLRAAIREVINFKTTATMVFMAVSFAVLALGFFWPKSYVTSTLLYADVSNIIQPLLKGRAVMTTMDRSERAREVIYTRRIMEEVAKKAQLIDDMTTSDQKEKIINGLRAKTYVVSETKNYFRIEYENELPDKSFEVLNALVNVFIEDSARQKREESYGAFKFIDAQVQTYKGQLELAERNLKDFKASNLDGNERSVASRISNLRNSIGELKLTLAEHNNEIRQIQSQLNDESKYLLKKNRVDEYKARLSTLKAQLDQLRLSYTDSYPDVLALKARVDDLQREIVTVSDGEAVVSSGADNDLNPLYDQLRQKLAETSLQTSTERRRLVYLENLLKEEFSRSARVAERQAESSDLTRDYDVIKQVYEEMLGRKESARLSMTLDIEGQGVSYKIQEPAIFPLFSTGLQFFHFALIGPLLGLLVPVGLVGAYVFVDPRLRSASLLASELPEEIQILGIVPHVNTPFTSRLLRADVIVLAIVCTIGMTIYGSLVAGRLTGSL